MKLPFLLAFSFAALSAQAALPPTQVEIVSSVEGFDLRQAIEFRVKPFGDDTLATLPKVTVKTGHQATVRNVREIPHPSKEPGAGPEAVGVTVEITPRLTPTHIAYAGRLILGAAPGYDPAAADHVPFIATTKHILGQAENGKPVTIKSLSPSGRPVTFTLTFHAMDTRGHPASLQPAP